jgi:hypothetical protein
MVTPINILYLIFCVESIYVSSLFMSLLLTEARSGGFIGAKLGIWSEIVAPRAINTTSLHA